MRNKLHNIIFGTTTKSGRNFDLILLVIILLSVLMVMVESVKIWSAEYPQLFYYAEWGFTIFFTIEYLLRIAIAPKPWKYITSTWGIIDLISIIPTYLAPFLSGYASFRAIRALRLLRVFRILKLNRFTSESQALFHSLRASYYKIMVFFLFVLMIMILTGTMMYVIEGGEHGFDSIPASIYWAIVTTTTVGYGDVVPTTEVGKILASLMMITGYVIIAVPTGLITVGMAKYKGMVKSIIHVVFANMRILLVLCIAINVGTKRLARSILSTTVIAVNYLFHLCNEMRISIYSE